MYRPQTAFTVPLQLLIPTYATVKGVRVKQYPEQGEIIFCSFKTYGGTEQNVNGVYSVIDTAVIETWYRPDLRSDCAVKTEDGAVYEVLGVPENIEMRNQFLKCKVQRKAGGA